MSPVFRTLQSKKFRVRKDYKLYISSSCSMDHCYHFDSKSLDLDRSALLISRFKHGIQHGDISCTFKERKPLFQFMLIIILPKKPQKTIMACIVQSILGRSNVNYQGGEAYIYIYTFSVAWEMSERNVFNSSVTPQKG